MTKIKGVRFIMTTINGGLLFLVPVAFLAFMLTKVFGFMLVIAAPMADWIMVDTIGGIALVKTLESTRLTSTDWSLGLNHGSIQRSAVRSMGKLGG